jgi:S1-C subfamily serine protease
MNNPQHNPMRKRFASATAILFTLAIMITIPSTAVAQQQRINSPSQGTDSSSNPLSLNSIFKQVENSVVQITSKTPTASNSSNQSSSNTNTLGLGSGFVYDKQVHIVT